MSHDYAQLDVSRPETVRKRRVAGAEYILMKWMSDESSCSDCRRSVQIAEPQAETRLDKNRDTSRKLFDFDQVGLLHQNSKRRG